MENLILQRIEYHAFKILTSAYFGGFGGFGREKTARWVNVRFLNFPDVEYGIVRGVVSNISVVPSGESYTLEVGFPNGLMTTYGKKLPFYQ